MPLSDMTGIPTGTVTFLLTDIEGSTRLWELKPEAMRDALLLHDQIIETSISEHNGYLPKTQGEGDSALAAFSTPSDAAAAALRIQSSLYRRRWPDDLVLKVRIGMHTGQAELRGGDYFGASVNRCARIRGIASGGQTLMSRETARRVESALPAGAQLRDLGLHQLKDLDAPERVFEMTHPDLPADFPPLRSLASVCDNLPLPLTTFVGRELEKEQVKELLLSNRLLTITGVGGVGKSRLAKEAGVDLIRRFPDGVWLVELDEAEDVITAIARALSIRETPGRSLTETIFETIRWYKALFILDGCERLITTAATFVAQVLRRTRDIRILATTREPLKLEGERLFPLRPFAVLHSGTDQATRAAVQLFVDRASTANSAFALTDANQESVTNIVRKLDGIPLAIELIAGRTTILSPNQIDERLKSRLSLATTRPHSFSSHHQSLRAALDWSYELLSEQERRVFVELAVFRGTFSLEDVEVVAGVGVDDVIDLFSGLVDKSLVTVVDIPSERRFRLLDLVQEYAREKLKESGQEDQTQIRHLERFLELAESTEQLMRGADQRNAIRVLDQNIDNLRAALAFTEGQGDSETFLRLAALLSRYWYVRGHLSEGRQWLEKALNLAGNSQSSWVARAYGAAGALARAQGDFDSARPWYEESLRRYQIIGDEKLLAWAQRSLGALAHEQGDEVAGRKLYEESLDRARAANDPIGIAESLHALGGLLRGSGEIGLAVVMHQEALAIADKLRDNWTKGVALNDLGWSHEFRGELKEARLFHSRAIEAFEEIGGEWGVGLSRLGIASVELTDGNLEVAKEQSSAALAIFIGIEDQRGVVLSENLLGEVELAQGNLNRGESHLWNGIELAYRLGHRGPLRDGLILAATASIERGDHALAARLLGAASALIEGATDNPRIEQSRGRAIEAARWRLGDTEYARGYESGAAKKIEDLILSPPISSFRTA